MKVLTERASGKVHASRARHAGRDLEVCRVGGRQEGGEPRPLQGVLRPQAVLPGDRDLSGRHGRRDRQSLSRRPCSQSVSSGAVNVVDTAINYRLQRAERSVGRALARLAGERRDRRRAGGPPGLHQERVPELRRRALHGLLDLHPGRVHQAREAQAGGDSRRGPLHGAPLPEGPAERSLANLGLECVDVLYLHNAAESWLAGDRIQAVHGEALGRSSPFTKKRGRRGASSTTGWPLGRASG